MEMLPITDMSKASLSKIVRDDNSFPLQFEEVACDFKDFQAAISQVLESNMNLLGEVPLPEHLNLEEIRGFLERKIKADLEKDPIFEKAFEVSKYTKSMFEYMDSYFREVFDYYEQRQKQLSSDMFCLSKMFLNSDLPVAFASATEDSILAEKDYIEVFTSRIRGERLSLIRNRSNKTKFKRVCDSHNNWVRKFRERLVDIEHIRVKLIWYVDFNNSKSLEEVFKDKIIKTSLLDMTKLSDFICGLQNEVDEMEKLNGSMMELGSVLPLEVDDGKRAIRRIMQILGKQGSM